MAAKDRRVIVIDVQTRTVFEKSVSSLKDCQNIVGGYIERLIILENGDELYGNEEALLETPLPDSFSIAGVIVFGNAYLIGRARTTKNGHVQSSVSEIQNEVEFLGQDAPTPDVDWMFTLR